MNHATSVGKIAPKRMAAIQNDAPRRPSIIGIMITPHTPPQNASEITAGIPNGGTACIGHARARRDAERVQQREHALVKDERGDEAGGECDHDAFDHHSTLRK